MHRHSPFNADIFQEYEFLPSNVTERPSISLAQHEQTEAPISLSPSRTELQTLENEPLASSTTRRDEESTTEEDESSTASDSVSNWSETLESICHPKAGSRKQTH